MKFWRFHMNNPHVYEGLVALARQAKSMGIDHYGIAALYEVLRWNRAIQTSGDAFKLNNDFRAHYARLIMEVEPDLADFFETRESPRNREAA